MKHRDIIWVIEVVVAIFMMVIGGGVVVASAMNIFQYGGTDWAILIVSVIFAYVGSYYYGHLMEG